MVKYDEQWSPGYKNPMMRQNVDETFDDVGKTSSALEFLTEFNMKTSYEEARESNSDINEVNALSEGCCNTSGVSTGMAAEHVINLGANNIPYGDSPNVWDNAYSKLNEISEALNRLNTLVG
jgi:hypothetical protein